MKNEILALTVQRMNNQFTPDRQGEVLSSLPLGSVIKEEPTRPQPQVEKSYYEGGEPIPNIDRQSYNPTLAESLKESAKDKLMKWQDILNPAVLANRPNDPLCFGKLAYMPDLATTVEPNLAELRKSVVSQGWDLARRLKAAGFDLMSVQCHDAVAGIILSPKGLEELKEYQKIFTAIENERFPQIEISTHGLQAPVDIIQHLHIAGVDCTITLPVDSDILPIATAPTTIKNKVVSEGVDLDNIPNSGEYFFDATSLTQFEIKRN